MAVVGTEWVVIGAVVVIILIFGPGQIPKMAKALGDAKREFDRAGKAIRGEEEEQEQG